MAVCPGPRSLPCTGGDTRWGRHCERCCSTGRRTVLHRLETELVKALKRNAKRDAAWVRTERETQPGGP